MPVRPDDDRPELAPRSVAIVLMLALSGLAALASPARAQDCTPDDALTRAAAVIALAGSTPSSHDVLDAARDEGSDAPVVHALRRATDEVAARWLARLAGPSVIPLRCGRADTEDGATWLVAPALGSITVLEDDPVRIVAELARPADAATLFVLDATGETRAYEITTSPTQLELPSDLTAPLALQLVATDAAGPRPVAERTVGSLATTAPDVTRGLPHAIGALRRDAERAPLRTSHLLDRLALAHAETVCRTGSVAHVVEGGGDAEDRLRAEGVEARHVGEVVARGSDVGAAWRALTESPSHRGALTDPRFTDAGIGTAMDERGRTCVVVLLAAWPRRVR